MTSFQKGINSAFIGMQRATESMNLHAQKLAFAAISLDSLSDASGKNVNGSGASGEKRHRHASVGRQQADVRPWLRKFGITHSHGQHGTELAVELVHIVNVQHNFDANAKSVSTIDTMWQTLLDLQV